MVTWPAIEHAIAAVCIGVGLRHDEDPGPNESGTTAQVRAFRTEWRAGLKDDTTFRGNDGTVERWRHDVGVILSHPYAGTAARTQGERALRDVDSVTRALQTDTALRALVDVEVRGYDMARAGDWLVTTVDLELSEDRELTVEEL